MTTKEYIDGVMMKMQGWYTPGKANQLIEHMKRVTDVQNIVEIGVFGGRSLIAMALCAKEVERWKNVKLFGVDPWEKVASISGFDPDDANAKWWSELNHEDIYQGCIYSLKECGVDDIVKLKRMTSLKASFDPEIKLEVDILNIDGNHSEEQALLDVKIWANRVKPGGIIAFDDMDWNTTSAAAKELGLISTMISTVEGCGIFVKK